MKKQFLLSILVIIVCILLASCATSNQFDRNLLQPSNVSVDKYLPNLEIKGAENTSQIGGQNQTSVSSYTYTIFEREMEENVISTTGEQKGSIEMNIVFSEFQARPGISGKYSTQLEFEIIIRNLSGERVWKKSYAGDYSGTDSALFWGVSFDADSFRMTCYSILEHQLIEEFKKDVNREYEKIVSSLQ